VGKRPPHSQSLAGDLDEVLKGGQEFRVLFEPSEKVSLAGFGLIFAGILLRAVVAAGSPLMHAVAALMFGGLGLWAVAVPALFALSRRFSRGHVFPKR